MGEKLLVAISDILAVREARAEGIVGVKASITVSQPTSATRPDAVVAHAERHTVAKWYTFSHIIILHENGYHAPRRVQLQPYGTLCVNGPFQSP